MSKIIVNEIKPNGGRDLRIVGNTNISGTLNGTTITTLSGATTFTGNTSGTCISQMYIDKLYGCNQELINSPNLIINSDVNLDGNVTAYAFYGDGSNITNLPSATFTGNTSGNCLQDLWVEHLNGCGGNLILNSNLNVIDSLSATTLSGDSSYMTKTIYDIIPVGSGITSSAYLEYGINLISTANTSNFCVRLPQTPIEGKQVNIINTSGFDIFVYPSMSGGSINGVIDGASKVPSDSKTYNFVCYKNPAPGSWSANFVQSTHQYDSGIISIDTSLSASPFSNQFGYVVAYDDNFKHVTNGNYYINGYFDGGKLQPSIVINNNPLSCGQYSGFCNNIMWKPTTPWSFIDKITVFTNFGQDLDSPADGGAFFLNQTYDIAYYDSTTGAWLGTEVVGQGQPAGGLYINPYYGICNQRISGSLSGFTTTPGDPGTWFGEMNYSLSGRPMQVGEVVLGTGNFTFTDWMGNVVNVTNADKIQTKYISFYFQSWQNSPDVKFRFLIDYTV
jgi:hypothetical protein